MGSGDERRHVIDGGNLFLFEQRHELILLLAWVGACCASANNCGGQHDRGANHSVCEAGDADAHGRISVSSVSPLDISLDRHQVVTVEASGACNDEYRN
jgi:hypothetical protein